MLDIKLHRSIKQGAAKIGSIQIPQHTPTLRVPLLYILTPSFRGELSHDVRNRPQGTILSGSPPFSIAHLGWLEQFDWSIAFRDVTRPILHQSQHWIFNRCILEVRYPRGLQLDRTALRRKPKQGRGMQPFDSLMQASGLSGLPSKGQLYPFPVKFLPQHSAPFDLERVLSKRKRAPTAVVKSLGLEDLRPHFSKPLQEAAASLGIR